MGFGPALPTIVEAIHASVSPVFMLTGIGALLNVLAGRLSRVVDRARDREALHAAMAPDQRAQIVWELRLLSRRMSIINVALFLAVASAVATCIVVALLFIGGLTQIRVGQPIAIGFIAATTLLIAAFTGFLFEVRLSIRAIRIRDELLR
ncbi:DUF2721 domain-containing protein [Sphingomonas adhaesiva]|uniref:DUF2721 domain-containing protein n=1 Tax=Sphingomonas adhaesiva TaxID=28212 RepID=UPI002FF75D10